jgi:NitT/TauT family transport system permease protein
MFKSNYKKILLHVVGVAFWLILWEILSKTISFSFLIPGVFDTLNALVKLIISMEFWQIVFSSFLRILLGYIVGISFATLLAFLSVKSSLCDSIFSKLVTIIKATPVAGLIMLIWFIVGSKNVPWVISSIIVIPILWQNLIDGYKSIDNDLVEVAKIYNFSFYKKLNVLILPSMKSYFLPALITSAGLVWKAGIAAEIIAYTDISIGKEIFDAKIIESQQMYAWIIVVITLSIIFEKLIKFALGRIKNA